MPHSVVIITLYQLGGLNQVFIY